MARIAIVWFLLLGRQTDSHSLQSTRIMNDERSAADRIWRIWNVLKGESLDLKEAGEKIVKQAAEAPTRQQQVGQLEYAKHIWEEQLAGVKLHWPPLILLSICCTLVLLVLSTSPLPISRFFPIPILSAFTQTAQMIVDPALGILLGFVLYQTGLERAKSRFRTEIERCNTPLIARA